VDYKSPTPLAGSDIPVANGSVTLRLQSPLQSTAADTVSTEGAPATATDGVQYNNIININLILFQLFVFNEPRFKLTG